MFEILEHSLELSHWVPVMYVWAQIFKTNDVVKSLLIKYGIYANIFAEKMWVAFAFAKATHIFSAKIPVNQILYLLEELTFWPLMSLLS